jgi:hypothetical protein
MGIAIIINLRLKQMGKILVYLMGESWQGVLCNVHLESFSERSRIRPIDIDMRAAYVEVLAIALRSAWTVIEK